MNCACVILPDPASAPKFTSFGKERRIPADSGINLNSGKPQVLLPDLGMIKVGCTWPGVASSPQLGLLIKGMRRRFVFADHDATSRAR